MNDLITNLLVRTGVFATPLFIGTLGEILTEKSGVMNLGMEGIIAAGALAGFIVGQYTHSLPLAILAAMSMGAFLALIHAVVSVKFKANQTVSGLALTMVGVGIAGFWGKHFVGQACKIPVHTFQVPLLKDIPILGPLFFRQDLFFYAALIIAASLWFILKKTRWGLYVRSVGENPRAADALGVPVERVRLICTVIGGALAGLAGAQLSLAYSTSWVENMSGGRGWIVVALTIFALWNPPRALLGSLLFGCIFVLQYQLQPLGISPNLLATLPYLATLFVLLLDGLKKDNHKLNAPAMLGVAYKREER
jgi:simple sugar transport system permease protein